MNSFNRREFLASLGLAAVTPYALSSCKSNGKKEASATVNPPYAGIENFGLQLWTVKDALAVDVKQTFISLGKYGYKTIESFQGDKGAFWGMQPQDLNKFLTDQGMKIVSSHVNPQYALDPKLYDEFIKLADEAARIDMKYLICPYLGFLKTNDEFKKATEGFNKLGEALVERGMKYAYHNHHYSFTENEGVYPQDIFMQGTDKNLVDFEMDIYWVVAAGQDPIAWLKKYPNRFRLCHVKDMYSKTKIEEIAKTEKVNPDFPVNASCELGTGSIDFPKILTAARDQGMQRFIVEQERFDNGTSLQAVEADAGYMKNFKFQEA